MFLYFIPLNKNFNMNLKLDYLSQTIFRGPPRPWYYHIWIYVHLPAQLLLASLMSDNGKIVLLLDKLIVMW